MERYRIQFCEHLALLEMGQEIGPWDLPETCALDVADWNGATLEEVGACLGIVKERVRLIEESALAKLAKERVFRKLNREFEMNKTLKAAMGLSDALVSYHRSCWDEAARYIVSKGTVRMSAVQTAEEARALAADGYIVWDAETSERFKLQETEGLKHAREKRKAKQAKRRKR